MDNIINKTQEYLNYIKEHYDNVQKAWKIVQEKCKHHGFISDDFEFNILDNAIKMHDFSKLSHEEFIPYRDKFYCPYKSIDSSIIDMNFERAWMNHKVMNDHHWQKWTTTKYDYPNMQSLHCVHMLVDWMAMGMKFGDTAESYYLKNKKYIFLPEWAEKFILEIFKDLKEAEK